MVACVACHGGIGTGNMPDYPILTSQYQDYLLHALSDYRSGQRNHPFMPIYAKTLSENEMQEITKYLANQRTALTIGIAPVERAIKSIKMVDIPGGEYLMGTNETRDPNLGRPEHKVTVPAFRMGKYAVTFDQFDAFAIDTSRALPSDSGWGRGTRPVINVTLKDTEDFIAWLNKKTGKKYRLPSEAEREYAARAGSSTDFWWGDTLDPEYVNGSGVKGRDQWQYTAPVGQFLPNKFGLYDMSGNVWERTADCWHTDYAGAPADGSAWVEASCPDRVIRGSYWGVPRVGHFTRYRAIAADAYSGTGLGFRLAEDQ
jgi:formylglycine-generating enzyme required for sulfatase activity